jgi:hypothetical protein
MMSLGLGSLDHRFSSTVNTSRNSQNRKISISGQESIGLVKPEFSLNNNNDNDPLIVGTPGTKHSCMYTALINLFLTILGGS